MEEEGSAALTGAPYSTLLSSGLFQAGRKRRGVSEGCVFFSHSLAQLSCGFAELPFVDSCTHIRCSSPLICLTRFIVKCASVVTLSNKSKLVDVGIFLEHTLMFSICPTENQT